MGKILHLRGTKDKVAAYPISEAELVYAIDTDEVFIGTGDQDSDRIRLTNDKEFDSLSTKVDNDNLFARTKHVLFVCPGKVLEGPQDALIEIPFDCEVIGTKALIGEVPAADMELVLEASTNFSFWSSMTADPVKIKAGSHIADDSVIALNAIAKGTYLRVRYLNEDVTGRNVSLTLEVKKTN